MALKHTIHRLTIGSLMLGVLFAGSSQAQGLPPLPPAESEATESGTAGSEFGAPRVLEQENSILSPAGGRRLLAEAETAIANGNYDLAAEKLQSARQIFNQLSNFYQQLSSTFEGINTRLSSKQRRSALDVAQLRDRATFDLATVHQAQGQPGLAVPLFVQIVRSQNPTSELGGEASEQLALLGFIETTEVEVPPDFVPPSSLISIAGGEALMADAAAAVDRGDYEGAAQTLQQARQVFNQLSNFHGQLAESFAGINPDVDQEQRDKARKTAQLRDEATYQLALVHRAQGQPELSVPLLIQIVRSQNPSSKMGRQAYQQLVELGFAESR